MTPGEHEQIEWYVPQGGTVTTHRRSSTATITTRFMIVVFFTCHDARTGEEVYGKQRFSPRGSFTASPWAYNGKIFCLSEDGRTYVVKAGPEFRIARHE